MDDASILKRWIDLRETTNKAFWDLYTDEHRYLVLMGGGGSGKSIFAGRKVLERCISEPGHRWLVCRKVGRTLRDSCFAQLRGQISEHYPQAGAQIRTGDIEISFTNGSTILFAGLDDVEKLKSIYNITGIWIEEASELAEEDFNQLDIRLRGETREYKQIILSFNPISITHWLKRRFFDVPDERARTHRSTYKDNRFLDDEAIRTLEGFRDKDPYYYQVYCLGQWGVTGKTVFNAQAVAERLNRIPKPIKQGFFGDDGKLCEEDGGPLQIFREPVDGRPYVIGGDTSGEGSDYFVAQVLDNITGEQVAVLRHQYDEDVYAKQVYHLGMLYNTALVGLEANFSTYPIKRLEQLGYTNQYVREQVDTFTGAIRQAFGFRTTNTTRPLIIGELVEAMRDGIHLVNDRSTLEEMLTFIRNEKLRAEAEPGAHDDCVLSLAIAWHIRPQQSMTVKAAELPKKRKWTADMWDDYRSAGPEERSRMIERWGAPN